MIKNKNDGKFRTLSILICSLQNRSETFNELMDMLNTQLHSRILTDGGWDNWQYQHYVEVIYDIDNGEKTVGEKRNDLLDRAEGDYVCFIDDDDKVSDVYIPTLFNVLNDERYEEAPDCIGFPLAFYDNGILEGIAYHSIKYNKMANGEKRMTAIFEDVGLPIHTQREIFKTSEKRIAKLRVMTFYRMINHLNPVKKSIALKCKFPEKNVAEDTQYANNLSRYLETEIYIEDILYHYLFNKNDTVQVNKPKIRI